MNDIEGTVGLLQRTPLQRSLSRVIYKEEYEQSLVECMAGSPGCEEMIASHRDHCAAVEMNKPLRDLVDALRKWKNGVEVQDVGSEIDA